MKSADVSLIALKSILDMSAEREEIGQRVWFHFLSKNILTFQTWSQVLGP